MKSIYSLLSIVLSLALVSCGDDTPDAGELTNTYEADYDKCFSLGLQNTHFKIDYPDGVILLEPDNNRDFFSLRYMKDGVIVEELWIGDTNIKKKQKSRFLSMIQQMVELHKYYSPTEIEFMGKREFHGQQTNIARVITDFAAYNTPEYVGEYKAIFSVPSPVLSDEHHSVRITMIAGENSEIKTFEDFESKGIVSQIYKSFRYIEGNIN